MWEQSRPVLVLPAWGLITTVTLFARAMGPNRLRLLIQTSYKPGFVLPFVTTNGIFAAAACSMKRVCAVTAFSAEMLTLEATSTGSRPASRQMPPRRLPADGGESIGRRATRC